MASLESVGELLREAPVPPIDPLVQRRGRLALLARAAEGGTTTRLPVWWRAGVGGIALGLLCVGLAVRSAGPTRSSVPALLPPDVEVLSSADAVWGRDDRPEAARIWLHSGSLSLRVRHGAAASRRLLIVLPDGEIEDLGTTFQVGVLDDHTSHVSVTEGEVELRLRGRHPLRLRAGARWAAVEEARVETAEPAHPRPAETAEGAAPSLHAPASPHPFATDHGAARNEHGPTGSSTNARRHPDATLSAAPKAPSPPGSTATHGPDLAAFDAAMRAYRAGEFQAAAAAFQRCVDAHPEGANAEDAAYLLALSRARSGELEASRAAARSYLERFPDGLRTPEMRSMAE